MSAEPKVLRYLGTAVNEGDDISKQCLKDTGIKIEYITATTDDVTKRVITQPNSFDVLDTEYFSLKKLVPSGNILALDVKKIKEFDNITADLHQGRDADGKKIRRPGHRALEGACISKASDSKKFATTASPNGRPDPDASTTPIRSASVPIWSASDHRVEGSAQSRIQGQGVDPQHPVDRHHGRRDGRGSHRHYKYADKGNMTKEEIDLTIEVMIEAKKAGQFRAFWKDLRRVRST